MSLPDIIRLLALAGSVLCCGGTVTTNDGGTDASVDSSDAGWTQCTSPAGYAVCGGANQCHPPQCACDFGGPPDELGVCVGGGYPDPTSGVMCAPGFEGRVCVKFYLTSTGWFDAPYDVGVLYGQNGDAAKVRYADLSLWTGDPLPTAAACPDLGNVQPCGGGCGACPSGFDCLGRSPLHPVGVCANQYGCGLGNVDAGLGPIPCKDYTTQSCFMYLVQPEAQIDADNAGICLPKADCDALVQKLPGGGKCYGGP